MHKLSIDSHRQLPWSQLILTKEIKPSLGSWPLVHPCIQKVYASQCCTLLLLVDSKNGSWNPSQLLYSLEEVHAQLAVWMTVIRQHACVVLSMLYCYIVRFCCCSCHDDLMTHSWDTRCVCFKWCCVLKYNLVSCSLHVDILTTKWNQLRVGSIVHMLVASLALASD